MRFLLFWIMLLSVASPRAQELSLQVSDMSLKDFFLAIKQQTGFSVFASEETLNNSLPVTISVRNKSIGEVLDEVLPPRMLAYQISSKTILVYPAPSSLTPPAKRFIEGFVLAHDESPIEGATVTIKKSRMQTAADHTGHFRIMADEGDIITISSVGYIDKEVVLGTSGKINIVMDLKQSSLDETTVIAYGTRTKKEMTGSVDMVSARTLSANSSASILDLLQGRMSGTDVTHVSASPGSGGTLMTIRGYNSLDVEPGRRFSSPLWVVDDVPIYTHTSPVTGTSLLADLDPDIIESIQVLKDASAAALYGSRASNGVVIVKTKQGKFNQPPQVIASLSGSYNFIAALPTITIGKAERQLRMQAFLNYPYAYVDEQHRAYRYPVNYREVYLNPNGRVDYFFRRFPSMDNGFYFQDSLNPFFNNATNFFPYFFEFGNQVNATLQAYGGASNLHYGIGAGIFSEKGVVTGSSFKRAHLHSHLNLRASPKLSVEMRFYAAATDRNRADRSSAFGTESSPIEEVPAEPFLFSSLLPASDAVLRDMKKRITGSKEENRSLRLRSAMKLSYRLLPDLVLSSSGAVDFALHRRNNFHSATTAPGNISRTIGESGINLMALNENLLTWEKSFGPHGLKALAGMAYQFDRLEYNGGQAMNSPSDRIYYARPGFPLIGQRTIVGANGQLITELIPYQQYLSDMSEKALLSYFSRVDYRYKERYFLTLSCRRDGSSVFGENTRWGMFPAVAAAWILPIEKIVARASWFTLAKLRASWGLSGMHFSQDYLALGILQTGQYTYQDGTVLLPDFNVGLYNEALTWEETDQVNLGLDLGFFDDRFTITADVFRRFTDNMLMPVRLPGTYNGYLVQWRNAAAVSNSGFDISAAFHLIRQKQLSWKVSINASGVRNRFERSYIHEIGANTLTSGFTAGRPLNGIYGYRTNGFISRNDQLPVITTPRGISHPMARDPSVFFKQGDYLFIDKNRDGLIDEKDQEYLGSALPLLTGGVFTSLVWKRFELDMLWTSQFGRHMINALPLTSIRTDDRRYFSHPLLLNRDQISFWNAGTDNRQFPPVQYDSQSGIYELMIDRHVERVNWIRLKFAQLRYTLPLKNRSRGAVREVQFVAAAENLLLFTNYSGLDPETVSVTGGIDYGRNYPLPRKLSLGFTLKM